MVKVALFTDTLDEMNGVSRFIRDVGRLAHVSGKSLHILTSSPDVRYPMPNRVNFTPRYARPLPYYPDVPLIVPPKKQMRLWMQEHRPDVVEISTPGLVGMAGLSLARSMNIPALAVYHTDFPAFVRDITGNRWLVGLTSLFMYRFYGRMAMVFSRTGQYIPILKDLGLPEDHLAVIPPFVDLGKFNPRYRNEALWAKLGVREQHKLLFCGRVSREKNMPMLAEIFQRMSRDRDDTALVVAGFGPYLQDLKERLKGLHVYYLGLLSDAELAELYASSDLYVFPSLTDTLGQVILEAQACGTPVLVSDLGGPKEVVINEKTGLVLPGHNVDAWVQAICNLLDNPTRLAAMRSATQDFIRHFDQKSAFEQFWEYFRAASGKATPAHIDVDRPAASAR